MFSMPSISELRNLVNDMHVVFPQGVRSAMRPELAKLAEKIDVEKIGKLPKFSECVNLDNVLHTHYSASDIKAYYMNYLVKVVNKEQNLIVKKNLKNLGVKIIDSGSKFNSFDKIGIVQALNTLKSHKFKLPKKIIITKLDGKTIGLFNPFLPKKILLSYPLKIKSCIGVVLHETAHLNSKNNLFFYKPFSYASFITAFAATKDFLSAGEALAFGGILDKYIPKLLLNSNKKLIKSEISKYALKGKHEFMAETVRTMLQNNKKWADMPAKIKYLYKIFGGPKSKTIGK